MSRLRRGAALLLASVLAVAACSSDGGGLPPPQSAFVPPDRSTTTRPDFSGVTLGTVSGQTTSTLLTTGRSVFQGVVTGPEGPVGGATVRLELLAGDGVHRVDVVSNPDGTFQAAGVPGGRYRLRAFRAPDLAMPNGQVRYVVDGEQVDLSFALEAYNGLEVRSDVTPDSPIIDRGVNLAVRLTERFVDDDGVGRSRPLPGIAVEVRAAGWQPDGEDTTPTRVTDADGTALWEFRCARLGPVTATAIVGVERTTVGLDVPACNPVPTTTTVPPSTVVTTAPTSTTTTEPG